MTSERTPTISIGMPLYNGMPYVRQAIESLLAQDFTDFELIISDNASTDDTYAVCQEYAARDPRVRLYRSERNLGAAPNYNRTLDLARGRYFKWACHDDWCDPRFLSRCLAALERDPGAVLAYPITIVTDDDGRPLYQYEERIDVASPDAEERFLGLYWNLNLCNVIFGLMRIDALRRTRMHPNYWEGDRVLLSELALEGRFVAVQEPLFYRRFGSPRVGRTTSWFDAAARRRLELKRPRQHWQHLRAIGRTDLPPLAKARLGANVLLRFAIGRRGRQRVAGMTSAVKHRLRRSPA